MNIVVAGSRGFAGRAVCRVLRAAGHRVTGLVSHGPSAADEVVADFAQLTTAARWQAILPAADVVINCVGLLREQPGRTFADLHELAPTALLQACEARGGVRFIQISALGAAPEGCSDYFRSKGRFDARLQASTLDWAIVRPSLIVGGASTRLFRQLASWPLLALPGGGGSRVQPVALDDVCELVRRLVEHVGTLRATVAAVGPRAVSFGDWLQQLRREQGQPRAPVLNVPWWLAGVAAHATGLVPGSLIDTASLRMLRAENHASATPLAAWLGRQPYDCLNTGVQAEAVLQRRQWQTRALLRGALALVWLVTAVLSFGLYPRADSYALLARVSITGAWAAPVLLCAAGTDLLLGLLTLVNPLGKRLWHAQLALVAAYTVIISLWLPDWWLHPFGPVLKNALVFAALLILLLTEENHHE